MIIDFMNEHKKIVKKEKNQNKNFVVKNILDKMPMFYLVNNRDVADLSYVTDTN